MMMLMMNDDSDDDCDDGDDEYDDQYVYMHRSMHEMNSPELSGLGLIKKKEDSTM